MLLDLGLPQRDGLEVLKGLRARKLDLPVLVMTARDTVRDRIAGLDAGADDYLVKPFDLDELSARVRALLRRAAGRAEPLVERGPLVLNPATHEVRWHGETLDVSGREFALLAALAERQGAVVSRAQLEEKLYGWNESIGSERGRGAHPQPASQAGRRRDPHRPRTRLPACDGRDVNSIRRRLLAALLGALLLAGLAGALATYLSARGEVDRLLDEELRQVALSLRDHAQLDYARLERGTDDPDLRVLVQIWDPAFDRPYSSRVASPLPRQASEGYTTVNHEGRSWRIYTTRSSTQTIQVAQPTALRTELAALTAAPPAAARAAHPAAARTARLVDRRPRAGAARRARRSLERRAPASLEPVPVIGAPGSAASRAFAERSADTARRGLRYATPLRRRRGP